MARSRIAACGFRLLGLFLRVLDIEIDKFLDDTSFKPCKYVAAPTNTLAPFDADEPSDRIPVAVSRYLKRDSEDVEYQAVKLIEGMSGMAPRCKLVSLRVLDENGKGTVSNLIAAIGHVQEINNFGRKLLIHGINMSLGYTFEPEWFACGQSPLCV